MGFTDFFSKAAKWVVDKAKQAATSVKDGAEHAWRAAKDFGKKVAQSISSTVSKATHVVVAAGKDIAAGARVAFQKAESAVTTVYSDVVAKPLGALENSVSNFSKGFSSPLTWLAVGLGAVVILPAVLKR
jgi:hypothetical protein